MSIEAKLIINDKFWIVEDLGVRIGTLSKDGDGFLLSKKGEVVFFKDEQQLKKKFGKNFLSDKVNALTIDKENNIYGFPCKTEAYNSMYDIKRKLPLFTKSEKSKSVYCAGYYLIKFNVNWLKSFCPKLITVERNEYLGPFKTEIEMRASLANVSRTA